jgi:prepilin-type N-terminal cleavage/methylation domain-containing protein/prepilin-type processing-associated H-X9-DG protein
MKTRAFTLIELLVVIAIIAILMAILMPSLRLARDQAHAIRCVANIKSLTLCWLLYKDDYDAKMVGGHVGGKQDNRVIDWVDSPTGTGDPIEIKQAAIKRGLLWSYVKEFDVYRCPGDQRITRHNQDAFRSYSIAGTMFGEERYTPNWSGRALWSYAEIKAPALKYVFVEEIDPRGHNMGSWVMEPDGSRWIDPLAIWHNKRSTFSYADGSAEKHRWVNQLTMDMAAIAAEGIQAGAFSQAPPASEREDIEFMHRGYQLWPSTRNYQDRR